MNIDRIERGPVTLLRLDGDIDEEGVKGLRLVLLDCIKGKRTNIVVNLSRVGVVSYMGLGVLVERLRHLRRVGGDMKLVGPNVYTKQLFRMAGVASVFDLCDTEPHAVDTFRKAA